MSRSQISPRRRWAYYSPFLLCIVAGIIWAVATRNIWNSGLAWGGLIALLAWRLLVEPRLYVPDDGETQTGKTSKRR